MMQKCMTGSKLPPINQARVNDLDDLFLGLSGSFHGYGLLQTLSSKPA